MPLDTVEILDTTLRDGLRNSGITMGLADKVRFARQLERLGLDVIEIGYGGPHEVEPMREIAAAVSAPVVVGLSRVNLKDVRRVLQGVQQAKRPGVNIFSPTSDAFLRRAEMSREQALDASAKAVAYAKRHVDHVQFSAQDASRSEPSYLAQVLAAVVSAGATAVCLTDTVSHATPAGFAGLCRELRTLVASREAVRWSVHCHNGRGLAVANCIAALEQGVRQVECTVTGIGEGAGNTPLEDVLGSLGGMLRTNLSIEHLAETGALLRELSRAA